MLKEEANDEKTSQANPIRQAMHDQSPAGAGADDY